MTEKTAEEKLFDTGRRTETGERTGRESEFAYENRSANPEIDLIRQYLEDWYSHLHDQDKDLRARFRSKDDYQHRCALFELYCHEILRRCGYGVEVHPDLPGREEHPDFLTYDSSKKHKRRLSYLECRMVLEPEYLKKAGRIKQELYAYLEGRFGTTGTRFFIKVMAPKEREQQVTDPDGGRKVFVEDEQGNVREIGKPVEDKLKTPSIKAIYGYFERELNGINSEQARAQLEKDWQGAEIQGIFDEWHIVVVPLPFERESPGDVIAMKMRPLVQEPESLLRLGLDEKSAKYGDLGLPFVIAVNTSEPVFMYPPIVHRALYGFPDEPGWFLSSRHGTRVSAVAVVWGLNSWNVAANSFELWHNPYATHPLDKEFWPDSQYSLDPVSGETSLLGGTAMNLFLGLSP
jgi:hypothetical protein